MKFTKYPSIENHYRDKFINEVISRGHADGEWVVQEKVHGANFSIWTTGQEVLVAKRSDFIESEDGFYSGYSLVVEQHQGKVLEILKLTGAKELVVYGELFGGLYSHPDVKREHNASRIQKGVHYAPFNEFYAFDICVDGVYLSVDYANKLFEEVGLFYARSIFRGSFKECLEHPNEFATKIPVWFGLPEIEGNICEGVIIKPVENLYLFGTDVPSSSRVIIKSKNAKWSERESAGKRDKSHSVPQVSQEALRLLDELSPLVTANRLENVVSKIGEVEIGDFGKLMGLLIQDVLREFEKDFSEEFAQLDKKEQKIVKKRVGVKAAEIVKEYFM